MAALPRLFIFAFAVIASAVILVRLSQPPPPAQPTGRVGELRDLTPGALPAPLPAPSRIGGPPEPPPPAIPVLPATPPAPKSAPPPPPRAASRIESPAPPAALQEPQLSDQEFYARFSRAVVQIFCSTPREVFAASGVIVNERGLVLTNAHVAEVVGRAGRETCQARGGNPAERLAKIEIVFSASTTLKIANTDVPQRDVAFLRLVDSSEPLAAAPVGFAMAERGATLLTLGYPSEFLQGLTTAANSNLAFSVLRVDGYGDLDGDPATAEAYVSRGGIVLQQGSSGTALFARSGTVMGLMFATTKGKTTDEREGLSLMIPYIDRILRLETGQGLAEFIASH